MKTFIVYLCWMAISSLIIKIGIEQSIDVQAGYFGVFLINTGVQLATVIPVGIIASVNRKDDR